jgi:hypothetical protein
MANTARGKTAEQHLQALEYANRVRLARAEMKRRIAAQELSAAEVILTSPWQSESMSISDLLMSQKRWGRARCRRLLLWVGVPENKRIGTLTERQRRAMASVLSAKDSARPAQARAEAGDRDDAPAAARARAGALSPA